MMQAWHFVDRMLGAAGADRREAVAISYGRESVSYDALARAVAAWEEALTGAGCGPGRAVVTVLPNRPVLVAVALACLRRGIPFVPLDPSARAHELDTVLARLRPALVLHQGPPPVDGHACVALASAELAPPPLPIAGGGGANDSLEGAAVVQFTSGSTGQPKGIVLTCEAVAARVESLVAALCLTPRDVTLCSVPLTHSHGLDCLALPTLLAGGRLILMDAAAAIPAVVFERVEAERVTFFSSVPQFYQLALALGTSRCYDLSSLRLPFCGSAALSAEVAADFERAFGVRIRQGYGLAEIGVITLVPPVEEGQADAPRYDSVGRPLPGLRWRLDAQGQLVVAGAALCSRYFEDAEGTAERLPGGELHTQDLMHVDANGDFYLVGRLNDAIHVGAQKVYPLEIERAVAAFPEIGLCAVVPAADGLRGQVPVLHAELAPGHAQADRAKLAQGVLLGLRERLSDFKVPVRVVFHERLPRSPLGKVLRAQLREPSPVSAPEA